jgi:hypothetical protein
MRSSRAPDADLTRFWGHDDLLWNRDPATLSAPECKFLLANLLEAKASKAGLSKLEAREARELVNYLTDLNYDDLAPRTLATFLGDAKFEGSSGVLVEFEDKAHAVARAKKVIDAKVPNEKTFLSALRSFKQSASAPRYESDSSRDKLMRWLSKLKDDIGTKRSIASSTQLNKLLDSLASFEARMLREDLFDTEIPPEFARALTNSLLDSYGLPPARLYDADLLKDLKPDAYREVLLNGMASSLALREDLEQRAILGLSLESSPELLYPGFARVSSIDFHQSGSSEIQEARRVALTDSRQWGAYVMARLGNDETLRKQAQADPLAALRKLSGDYADFVRAHRIDFKSQNGKVEEAALNLVDADFMSLFGRSLARDAKAYRLKLDTWFFDDVVWRGHAYGWQKFSDDQIVDLFKNVHRQMASIQVGKKILGNGRTRDQARIRKWVFEDFRRYNSDVLSDELAHQAQDHLETGPLYKTSYGYSTSKRWDVAKSFARGKTAAKYGDVDSVQDEINSRLLVGALRGRKDVDFNRLKRFDSRFKYIYGRQQEVMGIGAADPDSILFVQVPDTEGEIVKTFWRDREQPSRILLVEGDWRDTRSPPRSRVLKEYELR